MGIFIGVLGLILVIFVPLSLGQLLANWLVTIVNPTSLLGWVYGLLAAAIITLISIAAQALYRDRFWQGLMHPFAYMGSVILLVIALFSLPAIWGQLRLLQDGITVSGAVMSLSTGFEVDSETGMSNTIYYTTYQFETAAGEIYEKRVTVARELYNDLAEEGPIPITYLPTNPKRSLPETGIQPQQRMRLVMAALIAIYVALVESMVIQFFWERGLESTLERLS